MLRLSMCQNLMQSKQNTFCRTLALLIFICVAASSQSQTIIMLDSPVVNATTVVYPGLEYQRSGYHNLWWGKHYRKEWATAVRVNNFYLDTAKGGLTVVKEGGSRQSMGLRLKERKGKNMC